MYPRFLLNSFFTKIYWTRIFWDLTFFDPIFLEPTFFWSKLIWTQHIFSPMNYFYGRCPEGIGRHNVKMSSCLSMFLSIFLSICHVTFSRPLIGQKWECYIVEEDVDVDELDEGYLLISAAAGKQGN